MPENSIASVLSLTWISLISFVLWCHKRFVLTQGAKLLYHVDRNTEPNCSKRKIIVFGRKNSEKGTILRLWNNGRDTLKGEHRADSQSNFKIILSKDGRCDVGLVYTDNEVTKFDIIKNSPPNEIWFKFDYLAHKEGAVIKIVHDAEVKVLGIKGISEGKHYVGKEIYTAWIQMNRIRLKKSTRVLRKWFAWAGIVALLAVSFCTMTATRLSEINFGLLTDLYFVAIMMFVCFLSLRALNDECPDKLYFLPE